MKKIATLVLSILFLSGYSQNTNCKRSYSFSGGAGDKITLPFEQAFYDTLGFTWEAWIWIDSVPTGSAANVNPSIGQVVIAAADGTNCADIGLALGWGDWEENKLIFTADGEGCVRDPNPPSYTGLVSKRWYHVAAVADYTGGWAYLYVDGQLVSSSNYFGLTPGYRTFQATVVTNIGNLEVNNSGFGFKGHIDEVRIWNTVRSAAEIEDNMSKCLTGSEAGLVSYYNAQHTSLSTAEDVTTNYNATINGQATLTDDVSPDLECCKAKGCEGSFKFTGTSGEVVSLASDHNLYNSNGFTWEAWIKPAAIPAGFDTLPVPSIGQAIITAADLTNCADIGLSFGWAGWAEHRLVFTADGAGCARDANPPTYVGFQNNTWYHIAAVADYTGGLASLYVNGVLVSSSNYFDVNSTYQPFADVVSVQIGNIANANYTFPFNGLIDEVRIWGTVRTANQIATNKDLCLSGTEQGLVAYYKATEQNTDTAYDEKNMYHGTLSSTSLRDGENAPLACCDAPVGISSIRNFNQLVVYPNPVTDLLYIQSTDIVNTSATIFNALGQRMMQVALNTTAIDVSALPTGIYILELSKDNKLSRAKFVVE